MADGAAVDTPVIVAWLLPTEAGTLDDIYHINIRPALSLALPGQMVTGGQIE